MYNLLKYNCCVGSFRSATTVKHNNFHLLPSSAVARILAVVVANSSSRKSNSHSSRRRNRRFFNISASRDVTRCPRCKFALGDAVSHLPVESDRVALADGQSIANNGARSTSNSGYAGCRGFPHDLRGSGCCSGGRVKRNMIRKKNEKRRKCRIK
jgi:hypothetical protein